MWGVVPKTVLILYTSAGMKLEEFVIDLKEVLELADNIEFLPETLFSSLPALESLMILNVLAFVDTELNTQITNKELLESRTVEALFDVIMSKKSTQ